MNRYYYYFLFLLSTAIIYTGCANPFKDIDIRIDTNIFKYTAVVEVFSNTGEPISNATVTLRGKDADKIYNAEGKKEFKVSGGMLLLALDPKVAPQAGNPVTFSVDITANDYLSVNIPVTINAENLSTMVSATMINTKNLSQGLNIKTSTVTLGANGATTAPVVINTATSNGVTETVSIALPAGTQFKDAQGNIVNAGPLAVKTLVANTSSNDVQDLFPGGGLSLSQIKTASGATSSGNLLPAALTEVSMSAGNTSIKSFNQPIQITLQLDQNYFNPLTNATVKEGDQLQVYSYSADQGIWTFENTGLVVKESGKLALKLNTTHLTWFTAGAMVSSCTNDFKIQFNASWLSNGITHPVTYKVFSVANGAKDKQLATGKFTVTNGTEGNLNKLPSSAVIISYYDVEGNELAAQNIANPCSIGSVLAVTLNTSPVAGNPKVTMQLYVRCPNNKNPVTLLPTFYLYYKDAGAPTTAFKLLGTVTKGYISTTLLSTSKPYDFKAVWGSYVKLASNKTVSVDNAATVGDGPNEIIGTMAGATNLEMLKEVCKENGY